MIYPSDLKDPIEEESCKFGKNCKQKFHVRSPVHKRSTECTKVSNDSVRLWQSADINTRVVQSNTPNREQGKCQKTLEIGSKVNWPQDKYELALQVKKRNRDKIQLANSDLAFQKWAEENPDNFGYIPLGPLLLPQTDSKNLVQTQ